MTDTAKPAAAAEPKAPRRNGRRLVLLSLSALVLVGGGVGATAVFRSRGAEHAAAEEKPVEHGLLSLEPFVVNLADQGGSRFLRASVRLVVDTPERAEQLRKDDVAMTRLRSAIIDVLTEQHADRLVTAEGKASLKKALASHAQGVLSGAATVSDVLFSEFVVQF